MLDYIFSIIIFLIGFIFIDFNRRRVTSYDALILKKLWLYHILFILLFYFYTQNNSADANGYWNVAKNSSYSEFLYFFSQGPGTKFMYMFNYFPAKVLDLSIFTGMMFYGLLGFIGFYFFYRITLNLVSYNSKFLGIKLFPFLFFLPNLHFWSAGVGKDTLMFFSIGMFSFAILKISKRIPLIILSSLLMYMVRPHVLIMLLFAFSIAFIFSNEIEKGKKINTFKKVLFSGLLIGLTLFILPIVLQYVNLEESSSIKDVLNRTNEQAKNLSGSHIGSSIDISNLPFVLKMFTFLYRPLFFDFNGLSSLLASFENLLFLALTIKMVKFKFIVSYNQAPLIIKGLAIFLILGTLVFSISLSNLGIILRMKNMFVPGLLIFILWSLSYQNSNKLQKRAGNG